MWAINMFGNFEQVNKYPKLKYLFVYFRDFISTVVDAMEANLDVEKVITQLVYVVFILEHISMGSSLLNCPKLSIVILLK